MTGNKSSRESERIEGLSIETTCLCKVISSKQVDYKTAEYRLQLSKNPDLIEEAEAKFFLHTIPGLIDWDWLLTAVELVFCDQQASAKELIKHRQSLPKGDELKKVLSKSEMKILFEVICRDGNNIKTPEFRAKLLSRGLRYDKQIRINGDRMRPVLSVGHYVRSKVLCKG